MAAIKNSDRKVFVSHINRHVEVNVRFILVHENKKVVEIEILSIFCTKNRPLHYFKGQDILLNFTDDEFHNLRREILEDYRD